MANAFVHIELNTGDLSAAKQFYKKIFDWKLAEMPMGPGTTYTTINVGEGVGGGMATKQMPDAPTAWLPYVMVDSVKKTIGKAKKNGAQIVVEYMPISDMGAIGIFVDPTGATLGLWEMAKKPAAKKPAAKAKQAAPAKAKKPAPKGKKK